MSTVLYAAASLDTPHPFSAKVNEGSYIVALASTPSPIYAALATNAAQGNSILLYSLASEGLALTNTISLGNSSYPSAMRVVQNFCGRPTLLSSHQQPGCIKVWDERRGAQPVLESQSIVYSPKSRAILSFDVSSHGQMLAAGTDLQSDDASIFYWDSRNLTQPLHTHSSTHSDDITTLHFHPTSPHILLSSSTDGLLSTSDALEADEDEAIREVANWGCSVARAGWFAHDDGYGVWAASDMETFGLWNGNLDFLVDFGDLRQPSLPGCWSTDYLVDACDFSRTPGPCGATGLTLFLGSNSGNVAFATITEMSNTHRAWSLSGVLRGGHSDAVVRSVLWDQANGVLLTGDEAGRLSAWRPTIDTVVEVEDIEMACSEPRGGMKRSRDDDQQQGIKRGRYGGWGEVTSD